jgi:hypothetical protein
MVNPQMARMASRSCQFSSKVLTIGGRGGVHRCKHSGEFSTAIRTAFPPHKLSRLRTTENTSWIRRGLIRYSCGNGANVNDAGDIDRATFTHEVKIEMPDVGDDIDCE